MKKNILITGGAGYIGSVLVRILLLNNFRVTVLDNFIYNQENVFLDLYNNNDFTLIRDDVRNLKVLKKTLNNSDIIIPLAAIVGAPACKKNRKLASEINTLQIHNICKMKNKKQIVILPVTNSGYGIGQKNIFCTEKSPLNPISHYGRTKVEAEKIILKSNNFVSLRLATVFGVSNRMRTDLLVNNFVYEAFKKNTLQIYEGNFKRNFIHIRDVCYAILFCINNFKLVKNNVYNIGLEEANLSKLELAYHIKKFIPSIIIKENNLKKDPDKRNYIVSNKKILSTGWKPVFNLEKGIKELLKCYSTININNSQNI
jgi:nucleoside-diphosphate-sugar epimerase